MKEAFRKNLQEYGEIAKKREVGSGQEWEKELQELYKQRVGDRLTRYKSEKEIFAIQKKKQSIMKNLKDNIEKIRDGIDVEMSEGERIVTEKDGRLLLEEGGEITKAELLTDGDWGIDYHLDTASVSENLRKKYLIEQAKKELMDLLDEQIIESEVSSKKTHEYKRDTYEVIRKDRKGKEEELAPGLIAEKMVKNVMKKISIDCDVDFTIKEADVFQDVENKIDFIIKINAYKRGVDVQAGSETIGIQFTIGKSKKLIEHKNIQIDRSKKNLDEVNVDDLVLVNIPLDEITNFYDSWSFRKASGGPDKLWSDDSKEKIFKGVMQGVMSKEDINEQWEKINKKEEQLDLAA